MTSQLRAYGTRVSNASRRIYHRVARGRRAQLVLALVVGLLLGGGLVGLLAGGSIGGGGGYGGGGGFDHRGPGTGFTHTDPGGGVWQPDAGEGQGHR